MEDDEENSWKNKEDDETHESVLHFSKFLNF
jgi:hypothetical protein